MHTSKHIIENSNNSKKDYEQLFEFFHFQKYHQRTNKIPNFPINIINAHLIKTAKITDFMMFRPNLIGCDFIISNKVYVYLKKLNMPETHFYPVSIYSKEKKIDQQFYLLYTPFFSSDLINFPNSILFRGNEIIGKTYYNIVSRAMYREYISKAIEFEKMILPNKYFTNLDYISMQTCHIFISKNLKNIIENENLTGLNIISNDILHFE